MQPVIVVIATVQVPVLPNHHPLCTSPLFEDAQTVHVTTNATEASPEPSVRTIEMVFLPAMPVRTDSLPLTLHIAEKGAATVAMMPNTSVGTPSPSGSFMENMVVIVAAVKVPILAHHHPPHTIPLLQDTQAIQIPADTFLAAPEPTRWTVVMILFPQLPVGADLAPFLVNPTSQNATSIKIIFQTSVAAPKPPVFVFDRLVIQIARVKLPISLHNDPFITTPSFQDALTILMMTNFPFLAPKPSPGLVEMIFLPHVPVRTNFTPTVQVPAAVQVTTNPLVTTPFP